MNKHLLITFFLIVLTIFIIVLPYPTNAEDNYIIDGDMVYINDENVYLSAQPHTIYESGYVYFNLTSKNYNGNIDAAFGFNTSSVKPKKAELYNENTKTWVNFPLSFTLLLYSYKNCDKWYYIKDIPIISNKNYRIRIWIETPITTNINKGKYLFAVKPSFETIQQSIDNNRLYVLDPWFNTSFTDRQKIIITTNGTTIPQNYQILLNITYNSNMQNDFDDLRFTNYTNSELSYWIETKINSNYVKVWINLSNEIIHPGNDIIYMYYGNGIVNNKSNGYTVFNIFDNFNSLNNWTIQGGTWSVSDGKLIRDTSSTWVYLRYNTISPIDNYILESKYKKSGRAALLWDCNIPMSYTASMAIDDNLGTITITDDWSVGASDTYSFNSDIYYIYSMYRISDIQFTKVLDISRNILTETGTSINGSGTQRYFGFAYCTALSSVDWILIRKYLTNEPIISYNITEYYTNTLYYNVTNNYNHTIESDATIIVNRSISTIDNTYWSAKSTNITYWIFTKEINNSGYTNFTIKNNNLNNFTVKLKQYSYYNLSNSSLVNTFETNQYGNADININLIPDDYYILFINQSLIPPPIKPLYPVHGVIIIKDGTCINNINKIIVYKNNSYNGIYNYSDEIIYLDNNSYTFFINYDNIDIINSENFLISFFKNYGYMLISIIGIIIIIGICIYFFKKVKR